VIFNDVHGLSQVALGDAGLMFPLGNSVFAQVDQDFAASGVGVNVGRLMLTNIDGDANPIAHDDRRHDPIISSHVRFCNRQSPFLTAEAVLRFALFQDEAISPGAAASSARAATLGCRAGAIRAAIGRPVDTPGHPTGTQSTGCDEVRRVAKTPNLLRQSERQGWAVLAETPLYLFRNQQVSGSNPLVGSRRSLLLQWFAVRGL
jgi:hypothetical protein